MRQDEWTRDHVRQLREGFNMGWSDEQLGAHLGRTVGAIKSARGRFKLLRHDGEARERLPAGMDAERKRGERLLDMMHTTGGKPAVNTSPINAVRVPTIEKFSRYSESAC